MKTEICPISACGARVLVIDVSGTPYPVNPASVEVLVEENGEFRKTRGYLPHAYTCVDITRRPTKQG